MMFGSSEAAEACEQHVNITCRIYPVSLTTTLVLSALMYSSCVLTVVLNLLVVISISHFRQTVPHY